MERKLFLGQFLTWAILLLGQLNGYKSCTEKERGALLELKRYIVSQVSKPTVRIDVLPTWTNETKSDCCRWKGVACNHTSRRVIELSFISSMLNTLGDSYPLNLSLLHPFEELRTMNLSWGRNSDDLPRSQFHGFFDDVEGYQSLRRLRNLEILDLSTNKFNNSIFGFLNAATSLKTLFLGSNVMDGPIPVKELKNLTNLEVLDLSGNRFDGSMLDLTHLKKLKVLDLSFNFVSGSMEELKVSASLEQLNLGGNILNGSMPDFTHLKKLKTLDLSDNEFSGSIEDFTHLKKLKTLDLSYNHFSGSMEELKVLTSLERLNLGGNRINGSMRELTHLKNLKTLDLSYTDFSSSMVLQELKDIKSLEQLNLRGNRFNGSMPVVCEMKNLQELDLSENDFVGQIPLCLGSLKKLRVLDLSSNKISGNLPSSFSGLESLEYLSLLDNNITGLFSLNPLTNFTKLKVFKLVPTSGMVQVDIRTAWQPKFQLTVLVLRFCGLEKIPSFLSYQKKLRLVDLSNNKLSGGTPTWLVVNNPELQSLLLQNNSFNIFHLPTVVTNNLKVLDFSANNIGGLLPDNIGRALPNLVHMNGSNNGFQGHFPSSIGEMKDISFLDLSYNNLSGKLPTSFFTGCSSLDRLKLSHNRFSGHFLPERTSFPLMDELRIDNNSFSGEIGVGLRSLTMLEILDMSNNCLTGTIPRWITELSSLDHLLLSNNFLRGTVPPRLLDIEYLDLSGNQLSGALQSRVNNAGDTRKTLFLHNNNFTGAIPSTLVENVQILDLRNNKLSGRIPQFVDLEAIIILLLKGNDLSGSIPKQLCALSNVRILDLSDNKLSGFIPSCLYKLSSRREDLEHSGIFSTSGGSFVSGWEIYRSTFVVEQITMSYTISQEFEIKFTMKQRYESYIGGSFFNDGALDYMYALDLSNNALSGVIPEELGYLSKLQTMNLSHNLMSSSIPWSFSNLKDIESLDLSFNKLQGSIPYQLTSLTFLAVFNVSYNNLSGIILQGRQFNTFNENSYLGNPFLCGPPTNRSCDPTKSSEEEDNGREEEDDKVVVDMLAFYVSTASTYVAALIGIFAIMCFDCPWHRAWLCIVDAFIAFAKSLLLSAQFLGISI